MVITDQVRAELCLGAGRRGARQAGVGGQIAHQPVAHLLKKRWRHLPTMLDWQPPGHHRWQHRLADAEKTRLARWPTTDMKTPLLPVPLTAPSFNASQLTVNPRPPGYVPQECIPQEGDLHAEPASPRLHRQQRRSVCGDVCRHAQAQAAGSSRSPWTARR
jgi:hypothetical protein